MQTSVSKTKNLEVYRILLNFKTAQQAYKKIDILARQLKRHKNGIISVISQARKNPLIFTELKAYGYADEQIPEWFKRPQEKEEPQPQTNDYTITVPNHSKQIQPVNSQITQTPQPRNFMGMQVYDLEEIKKYQYNNPPRRFTVADRITEDWIREYEEEEWQRHQERKESRRKEKEERSNREIERKLAKTNDPWTALQILKKIPKWRKWYDSLTTYEQNKTFESIISMYRLKLENKIIQENQRQWNGYFEAMWWQGRFQGKW